MSLGIAGVVDQQRFRSCFRQQFKRLGHGCCEGDNALLVRVGDPDEFELLCVLLFRIGSLYIYSHAITVVLQPCKVPVSQSTDFLCRQRCRKKEQQCKYFWISVLEDISNSIIDKFAIGGRRK